VVEEDVVVELVAWQADRWPEEDGHSDNPPVEPKRCRERYKSQKTQWSASSQIQTVTGGRWLHGVLYDQPQVLLTATPRPQWSSHVPRFSIGMENRMKSKTEPTNWAIASASAEIPRAIRLVERLTKR